jgi:hypothetical protein
LRVEGEEFLREPRGGDLIAEEEALMRAHKALP